VEVLMGIRGATVAAAALLACIVAVYGLYLVIVGPEASFHPAVPIGDPPTEPTTRNVPAIQGPIPVAAGALVLSGLAARRLVLAWTGAAVATAFASLFVFGVGGALLPVVAALDVVLGVHTWAVVGARAAPQGDRGSRASSAT
jgi:hypothetical protein